MRASSPPLPLLTTSLFCPPSLLTPPPLSLPSRSYFLQTNEHKAVLSPSRISVLQNTRGLHLHANSHSAALTNGFLSFQPLWVFLSFFMVRNNRVSVRAEPHAPGCSFLAVQTVTPAIETPSNGLLLTFKPSYSHILLFQSEWPYHEALGAQSQWLLLLFFQQSN